MAEVGGVDTHVAQWLLAAASGMLGEHTAVLQQVGLTAEADGTLVVRWMAAAGLVEQWGSCFPPVPSQPSYAARVCAAGRDGVRAAGD